MQLMGDVQIEILQRIIKERFGVLVEFGEGSIVYKETIAAPVEGVGHFDQECSLIQNAVRMCWIGTGSGWC